MRAYRDLSIVNVVAMKIVRLPEKECRRLSMDCSDGLGVLLLRRPQGRLFPAGRYQGRGLP